MALYKCFYYYYYDVSYLVVIIEEFLHSFVHTPVTHEGVIITVIVTHLTVGVSVRSHTGLAGVRHGRVLPSRVMWLNYRKQAHKITLSTLSKRYTHGLITTNKHSKKCVLNITLHFSPPACCLIALSQTTGISLNYNYFVVWLFLYRNNKNVTSALKIYTKYAVS